MTTRGRPAGYVTTDETKQKLSNNHTGRTNYYKRKVSVDGVIFASVTAAALHFKLNKGNVVYRLKNPNNNPQWDNWFYL